MADERGKKTVDPVPDGVDDPFDPDVPGETRGPIPDLVRRALALGLSGFFVTDESVVYDLGCATGGLVKALAEHNAHKRVRIIGVDQQPAMLEKAGEACAGLESVELLQEDLVETRLRETGFTPDRLILEITESAAMDDPERTMDVLTRLRLKGVDLSIDDRTTLLVVGAFGLVFTAGAGYLLSTRIGVEGLGLALSLSGVAQLVAYLGILRAKMGEKFGLSALIAPEEPEPEPEALEEIAAESEPAAPESGEDSGETQ